MKGKNESGIVVLVILIIILMLLPVFAAFPPE